MLLAFTLGPAELVVLGLGFGLVLVVISRRRRTSVLRRACPECRQINTVERAQLGKRIRCAACGSLLYPNEHRQQVAVANVHIHNTNTVGSSMAQANPGSGENGGDSERAQP